jgi:uncharacterized protein (TIGR02117 family)
MQTIKSLLYRLFKSTLAIMLVFITYFLLSYLFTFFPKNSSKTQVNEAEVYLLYNEMHTDILFNIKEINLSKLPQFKQYKKGYLAFGWGDKETYLNTPTWKEMKVSTTLKALFLNTSSLMHLTYYASITSFKEIKRIQLSSQSLKNLEKNIFKSFAFDRKRYRGYGRNDFFYSANGEYNIFQTCNSWTGEQLRNVGVKMSYWTPLSQNITASLP